MKSSLYCIFIANLSGDGGKTPVPHDLNPADLPSSPLDLLLKLFNATHKQMQLNNPNSPSHEYLLAGGTNCKAGFVQAKTRA